MTGRRRIAMALAVVMTLVTAWSLWSFAQQPPAPGRPTVRPPAGRMGPSGSGGPSPGGPMPGLPRPPAGHLHPRPAPPRTASGEPKESADSSERPEEPNWTDIHRVDKHGEPIPPYIAMLLNFGILAAAYYLLARKPVALALQSRRDNIARQIEEADKMRREAEQRATVYQAKLAHLEEEVKAARGALVRAGEAERDRMMADAEAKAARMRKDAEFLVEQELKQIRQDLWKDTVDAAVLAAEELLKKRVTPADHERVAEDYLADLGGGTEPAAALEVAS